MRAILTSFLMMVTMMTTIAQNSALPLQAESATLGSDFGQLTDGDVTYVTPATDFNNTSFPGIADKVITFDVTFAAPGVYDLYVRLRVGPDNANDDSFYFANGFGSKAPDLADDWVIVNNIGGVGNAGDEDYVSDEGVAGIEIWKWMNVSEYERAETPLTFAVEEGMLSQTFQLGARENGLDIDMIAFGNAELYYTVANLINGEEGVDELPDPGKTDPIATGQTKFLGSAYSNSQSGRFDWYWNQVTPENAGKWGSVEGTRDAMNWGGLDAAYNEARDNGFVYKHHVLFWGAQQPTWMKDLSQEEQLEEIHEWLAALAERYPDLEMIEVVNEPLHDPPFGEHSGNTGTEDYGGYGDALGGSGTSGWDWVLEGFRLAREYFPNAQLMLNDYNILNSTSNINAYLGIVDLLIAEELIDMIGVQGHAFSINNMSGANITGALDQLAVKGLPLYVTELDLDGPGENGELVQLGRFQEVFPALWEHEAVEGVTLWGFNPGHWREDEGATLVRSDGSIKPSLTWLRGYVEESLIATNSITLSAATSIMDEGESIQINAAIAPSDVTLPGIAWSVVEGGSGEAEIDQDGLLTGISSGNVEVVASAIDGSGVEGSIIIRIEQVLGLNAELSQLSLYPNPVINGRLVIKNHQLLKDIRVFDLEGRIVVESLSINKDKHEMSLQMNPGIYAVQIQDESSIQTRRIVVK